MRHERKLEFLAFLLPVGGAILILPPLVLIANVDVNVFGFPAVIAYLFAVWLGLVVASFVMQRKLGALQDAETETETPRPRSDVETPQ